MHSRIRRFKPHPAAACFVQRTGCVFLVFWLDYSDPVRTDIVLQDAGELSVMTTAESGLDPDQIGGAIDYDEDGVGDLLYYVARIDATDGSSILGLPFLAHGVEGGGFAFDDAVTRAYSYDECENTGTARMPLSWRPVVEITCARRFSYDPDAVFDEIAVACQAEEELPYYCPEMDAYWEWFFVPLPMTD